MLDNIEINCHSSIKINKGKIIYVDPFKIKDEKHDADTILITHFHYDHYSEEDIKKVMSPHTIIVMPKNTEISKPNSLFVEPNGTYNVSGIKIETIPAYNINKKFHPKQNGWVGYILNLENTRYYIAGDTDITEENKQIKCDIAFIPIGGTYTLDYKEAAELANIIQPKIVVPIHYGSIVGTQKDAVNFAKLLNSNIKCKVLIK